VATLPAWLRDARELDGRYAFLRERGRWFWLLVAAGAVARVYLVLATQGTNDVWIWESHARAVLSDGVAGAYRAVPLLNHPPLATFWVSRMLALAESSGIPFSALLRAPIAALDLGCVGLLALLLRESRHRFLIAGLYAIQPVAILLSAYHGNSDSSIGFFRFWRRSSPCAARRSARARPWGSVCGSSCPACSRCPRWCSASRAGAIASRAGSRRS